MNIAFKSLSGASVPYFRRQIFRETITMTAANIVQLRLNDGVRGNTLRKENICEVRILTVKEHSTSAL